MEKENRQPQKQEAQEPSARGGITIICFLIVMLGQAWLLRGPLSAGLSSLPLPFLIELAFYLPLLAGVVVCFRFPMGWSTKPGVVAAFAVFLVYAGFNIAYYPIFAEAYRVGIGAELLSAGGGFFGLKLVLVLTGVIAAMPVAAPIDKWEYSRRLREKVEKQNAEWAKATVQGAKKDLDSTLERLKETLSEEEMAQLIAELQETAGRKAGEKSPADEEEASEKWRGWGGGM